MQSCREMVQFYRWLSAFMYQRLHSRWRAVHRSRMVFGGYHFDIVLLWFWISVINSFSDGMSLAPIEQSAILSGGPGIVWLIFPTYLSSTPVGFGIHPGKWSCTHSHWPLQPPRLLYGRAANYGSFIVLCRGNDIQFSRSAFQHRASFRLGYCPLLWQ